MLAKLTRNFVAGSIAAVALLGFLIGFYDFFRAQKENECEMTWMYQFPHFVKIQMHKSVTDRFPMYGLYLYAEGDAVAAARQQIYTGIPVLFLPGNSGSHKQVRSFASVALYKALDKQANFHFDFYTIDFNEEISGLYGYVLNRQLEYSRLALEHIVNLYEDHHRVIIIGHSMGGMLAKTINLQHLQSHLVFTLATPHMHPVAIADPEFDVFYYFSNLNRTELVEDDLQLTVVGISGGDKDLLVSDKLGMSPSHSLQTSVPSVPGAWVSTDHLCILWCKQFVLTIVRTLFDLVEPSSLKSGNSYMRITTDQKRINATLNYHLVKRSSGKSIHSAFPRDSLQKPPKALWIEIKEDQYCQESLQRNAYVLFPTAQVLKKINGSSESHAAVFLTSNTKAKSWIFGCKNVTAFNGYPYCNEVANLGSFGEILPNRRKVAHLPADDLVPYTHVIIKALPRDSEFCIGWDVYDRNSESSRLPNRFTSSSVFKNFSLMEYSPKFLSWRIEAQLENTIVCNKRGRSLLAVFRHEGYQTHGLLYNETFTTRLIDWNTKNPHVLLYADPGCTFTVIVRPAYLETAGNLFRNYVMILPSYFASIILLSIYFQDSPENWSGLHIILLKNVFNLTILPGVLVSVLLKIIPTDYSKFLTAAENFMFLPIICYFVGFALVLAITTGGWYILMASGNGLHAIFTRLLTKKLGKIPEKITDFALQITFARVPIVIAVLVASLTSVTCGGFGICAGLFLYAIKIFKMYEDCMEDLLRGKISSFAEGLSPLNFHHTIASLWLVVAVLNIPSLIHWTRNFGYSTSLQVDISLYISLMLTPVIAILWQDFVPNFNAEIWTLQRYLSYMTGIFVVLWGTHRLYIIAFFVTLQLITLCVTQLFSSLLNMAARQHAAVQSTGTGDQITSVDHGPTEEVAVGDLSSPTSQNTTSEKMQQRSTGDKKND